MVPRLFNCDANRLKLFLDDRLSEDKQADIVRHLDSCRSCRQYLEVLAAGVEWWNEVQVYLRNDPSDEPVSESRQSGGNRKTVGQAAEEPTLEFLDRSDNPEMLGCLGDYEIEEVIGFGGMGIVLKGFDSVLNRYVAVKVLAPQLSANASARRRFAREAQAAAAVVHEHVISIHAVDEFNGIPYLVMPYIPGGSLRERLKNSGPLEVREILRIGMQTARGLAAAHAQGLVHRDVKPANLLLEKGVDRVMITDFGLARAVDDASLTRSGVIAGTPQYMAPEQADGKSVDHRADLFSLGSVIYAMCTGHPPFRAETTMAVLRRICETTSRPVQQINPDIPEWLAEIIEKLLARDVENRFQSAAEVADLLGRHLAHLQQPAVVPRPQRLAKPPASGSLFKNRRILRVLVATSCLLAVGLGVAEILNPSFRTGLPPGKRILPEAEYLSHSRSSSQAAENADVPDLDDAALWQKDLDRLSEELRFLESDWNRSFAERRSQNSTYFLWELDRELGRLERELDGGAL